MKFSEIEYKRIDFETMMKQVEQNLEQMKNAKSAYEVFKLFEKIEETTNEFVTSYVYVRIISYNDMNDEFYAAEQKLLQKQFIEFELLYQKMETFLIDSEFSDQLKEMIGATAFDNYRLNKKSNSEKTLVEVQQEKQLVMEYNQLLANLKVEFEGETTTISKLIKNRENLDRETRKRAFVVEGNCYLSIKAELDDIFDRLVKNRTEQAKKMGFENYVELGYIKRYRNCYDKNDVNIFRQQVVEDVVPLANGIIENRKKRLDIEDIKIYDMAVPFKDGSPKPKIFGDEIIQRAKTMYKEMSPKTDKYYNDLVDSGFYDVESRFGKSPGGFCGSLKVYKKPYIFANFNDTNSDIKVMTHEFGHAFAKYISEHEAKKTYIHYSFDIAEIHSMAMEFLASPWYHLFFEQDAKKYQVFLAEEAILFIPYACQVDEFQEYIYENPTLSPKQRDEAWRDIEKKYRPHLDNSDIPFYSDGAGWQRQTHIYKTPFYYIDYALAQIVALQIFMLHLENEQNALDVYFKLVQFGSSKNFVDLLKEVDLNSPFKEGVLKSTVELLANWIEQNPV